MDHSINKCDDRREESELIASSTKLKHISVCVCTFKRPDLLQRLLADLHTQETGGLFTYSVVVADNDSQQSAKQVVKEFTKCSLFSIEYCVEPQQNIALARNRAVANAKGDFIAFIDDDEFPTRSWLRTLFQTCNEHQADGVLGPVRRHFDEKPPAWLEKSQLYERRINPTGALVDWLESRTGNVLIKREIFDSDRTPFRAEFRAGEDQDFFRRKIEQGFRFIWSAEAVVFEVVPPARWKRAYMLKKALLRGATARLQPSCGPLSITKSMVAVPAYALCLPVAQIFGHQYFMTLLIKLCDHLGKLLALVGMNPIREAYVNDSH